MKAISAWRRRFSRSDLTSLGKAIGSPKTFLGLGLLQRLLADKDAFFINRLTELNGLRSCLVYLR